MDKMTSISGRSLQPGDILIESDPVIHCVIDSFKQKFCDNCLKEWEALKRCGKCRKMFYCDKDCQQNDWIHHKHECKVYRSDNFVLKETNFIERLLLRLYCCLQSDEEFARREYPMADGSTISLNDVIQSMNEITIERKDKKELMELFAICLKFSSCGLKYNERQMYFCFQLIKFKNLCGIMYYRTEPLLIANSTIMAFGLFLQLSSFKSTCLPNAAIIMNGLKLNIRAIKPIESGSDVCLRTINLCTNKRNRQKEYMKKHLKPCECDKCVQNLDEDLDYEEFDELLEKNMFHWETMSDQNYDNCHTNYIIDSQLILYFRRFYGEYHPNISGILLNSFICFATYSKRAKKSVLKKWFKEIDNNLLVTHGSDHPMYQTFRRFSSHMKII